MLESIFVVSLFLMYLLLWRIKQKEHKALTGIDPQVMQQSTSNVQRFMASYSTILTVYAALIIVMHSSNVQVGSLFSRDSALSSVPFDVLGFVTGLGGLSLCRYAQVAMGTSWRVGIDEKMRTPLVTTGLYGFVRNPTYLGLFLLNIGVWLIWPTWTVSLLSLLFCLFLEIQVRCEEDFLFSVHGEAYEVYKKRTKRYVPFIY